MNRAKRRGQVKAYTRQYKKMKLLEEQMLRLERAGFIARKKKPFRVRFNLYMRSLLEGLTKSKK